MRATITTAAMAALMLAGCTLDTEEAPEPTPVEGTAETEPDTTGETAPEETSEPLAAAVEQALLDSSAVDSFQDLEPTSPGFWIASIEDVSSDTIRVHFQTELADDERDQYGQWVAQMSCLTVDALDVVVAQDTTGFDSNYFLSNSPLCS